jgi:hypothetical protein
LDEAEELLPPPPQPLRGNQAQRRSEDEIQDSPRSATDEAEKSK